MFQYLSSIIEYKDIDMHKFINIFNNENLCIKNIDKLN